LQDSNDSTYKRMWTTMVQSVPSVFVNSNEEGVQRVEKANRKYAFFMESTSIEYQVERRCDLQQVGGTLDSKGYGIGLPIGEYHRALLLWSRCCTGRISQQALCYRLPVPRSGERRAAQAPGERRITGT
jgi:hypothetical protein